MAEDSFTILNKALSTVGGRIIIDRTTFEGIVDKTIHKSRATESIKREIFQLARQNQGKLKTEIANALTRSGNYGNAGRNMAAGIQQLPVYETSSSRRARSFIQRHYQGNWYAYKAQLTTRRVRANSRGRLRIAARQVVGRNPTRKEAKAYKEFTSEPGHDKRLAYVMYEQMTTKRSTGYIDTDLRFRKQSKSFRAIEKDKGITAKPSTHESIDYSSLGKVKSELESGGIKEAHSTARAVIASRYLEKHNRRTIPYATGKAGKFRNMPYVSSGLMARDLGKAFEVIRVDYVNHNKSKSQFTFSLKYSLDITKMHRDTQQAWIHTPYRYKRLVITGTNNMAAEYLQRILASRYGGIVR